MENYQEKIVLKLNEPIGEKSFENIDQLDEWLKDKTERWSWLMMPIIQTRDWYMKWGMSIQSLPSNKRTSKEEIDEYCWEIERIINSNKFTYLFWDNLFDFLNSKFTDNYSKAWVLGIAVEVIPFNLKNNSLTQQEYENIFKLNLFLNDLWDVENLNTKIQSFLHDGRNEYDQLNNKFISLYDIYINQISLQAPVEYWEAKRKKHEQLASKYKTILITSALILIALILSLIFCDYLEEISTNEINPKIYLLLVISTVVLIYFRIVIRLFNSNTHLENDAAERVAMIQTFLALSKDENTSVKNENIVLVLSSIFRPSGDGIVKDETAVGFMDYLSKRASN